MQELAGAMKLASNCMSHMSMIMQDISQLRSLVIEQTQICKADAVRELSGMLKLLAVSYALKAACMQVIHAHCVVQLTLAQCNCLARMTSTAS